MTDTLTAPRVQVQELDAEEVRTSEQLKSVLKRIQTDGLPIFVIRAAGLVDIGVDSHEGITNEIARALSEIGDENADPAEYEVVDTINDSILETGSGALHNDERSDRAVNTLHVHRTNAGQGKAFFANAGTVHKGSFNNDDLSFLMREESADAHLREGKIDPEIVNPQIHTTTLGPGDTAVFPLAIAPANTHDKAGPILHRFDTELAPRDVFINVLAPKK